MCIIYSRGCGDDMYSLFQELLVICILCKILCSTNFINVYVPEVVLIMCILCKCRFYVPWFLLMCILFQDQSFVDNENLMNSLQSKFLDKDPVMLDLMSNNQVFHLI